MYTFDRFVLARYLAAGLVTLLVAGGIFTLTQTISIVETVALHGRGLLLFGELVGLSVPAILVYVLPISGFVGVLYVVFHLQEEEALPVLYASGSGAARLLRPTAAFATVAAAGTAVFSLYLSPVAERTARDRLDFLSNEFGAYLLKEGQFANIAEGITVYVRDVDSNRIMHDLFIYDETYPEATTAYSAQRAALDNGGGRPQLSLIEGLAYTVGHAGEVLGVLRFDSFIYDIAEHFPEARVRLPRPSELFSGQLLRMDPESASPRQRRRYAAEGHSQLAAPMFAFALPFLALAGLLAGPTRDGVSLLRLAGASMLGFVFLLSFIGAKSLLVRSLGWVPLMYLLPPAAVALSAIALHLPGSGRIRPA